MAPAEPHGTLIFLDDFRSKLVEKAIGDRYKIFILKSSLGLGENVAVKMPPESAHHEEETIDDNLTNNLLRGDDTAANNTGQLSSGRCDSIIG